MVEARHVHKELLSAEDVAEYLGVGSVTVYRWCREGRLPCLKIGKHWRIRQASLEVEGLLERSEHSDSLVGCLRPFLQVPDNVLAVAQDREKIHCLDAAVFRVGDAQGGTLIKYVGGESWDSLDDSRTDLENHGLEVRRLEDEGRFRFVSEPGPRGRRVGQLRRLLSEEADGGRTVWVSFDWVEQIGLEAALKQQQALRQIVEEGRLVTKTAVLEEVIDQWPGKMVRRAQVLHGGTIWFSEYSLALSRVTPPPPN
jgi:excisionase family DNA binding protein